MNILCYCYCCRFLIFDDQTVMISRGKNISSHATSTVVH